MSRLKELRLKKGYKTQKDLADTLFVNQTAVSQWERGVTIPSGPMLFKLSELFGESIDYILGGEDKKEPTPVIGDGPSETAKHFMALVDGLTAEQQQLLLVQLQAWTEQNKQQALAAQQSDGGKVPESDS